MAFKIGDIVMRLDGDKSSYYGYTIPNDKIQAKLDKLYKETIKKIK